MSNTIEVTTEGDIAIEATLLAGPTVAVSTEGDTTIEVTPEGDVTIGVEYNPVAGAGGDTDIGITRTNAAVTVTSSSGTDGTILAADASNAGVFTAANFTKLAAITGTNTGDQSIFKNIAVAGQSTVTADTTNDTLTLVAGTNVTITTDDLTHSVTITASGGGGGGGDVVGPDGGASDGAFALFDGFTGKLLKNGSLPGGAATLDVGTSAGTVAAGDDSRFTDERTPTAHASTHVTGGTDAIQSATSSQDGLATSTQITKLDGIEALADVTDATNVAAAGAVMNTLADAKGDLFAATAADTVTRLPVGVSNGLVLTVDSAETTGMKWVAPASSGGDVVGPASSTDNAFARFDSTTGKLLQNSTATLDDVGLASVDGVQFSTTPTSTVGQAKAVWDTTDSCLSLGLNASVNALVGTDSHVQAYNDSASTMTVMQVVRQSGSSGTRLKVALALADTDSNSATSIGVVAQSIASNAQGFIQTAGLLQGVNTNAFNEGDTLWLSSATAGLITNVKPTAPNHGVRIGYCIKKAGGAGIILIDILNGFELDELHDVKITGPIVDNSFLTYDTTSAVWINEAPSAAKSSIGLGSVTNDVQTKAAIVPNTAPTAGQLLVGNAGGTAYAPVSLNNDATVASTGALTLATVNSNVGAFGSATQAPAVTVNAKGLVTAISASTITPAVGSITGLGTGVATALAVNVGSAGAPVVNGGALGTPASGTLTNCTFPTLNQNTSGYAEALKSATTTVSVSASAAPTSGQVLTATSGTAATWQTPSGGGGLTNITETLVTSAPNATVNAERLAVTGGTTNVNLVLTPKGTGGFILGGAPDGAATDGNIIGARAVDLQITHGLATRVASGADSFAAGTANTASGASATSIGSVNTSSGPSAVTLGASNTASGNESFAAGNGNSASNNQAVALGFTNVSSNVTTVAIGRTNNATGPRSVAIGITNTASGTASVALGSECNVSGSYAQGTGHQAAATRLGQKAHSAGQFAAVGDAQAVTFVLRNKTTNGTAVTLFLDGASTRLTLASGRVLSGTINIVGTRSDGVSVARYLRQFTLKNVAGTTSLVGSVITLGTDEATGTSISVTADDTNDALSIQVTGVTAETWRWVSTVDAIEIVPGT